MNAAPRHVVHRNCTICEATCGIDVHLEGGVVGRIAGDPLDPFSGGRICPKVVGMRGLQEDPDRLRKPLVKHGGTWREASWETALDAAAEGPERVNLLAIEGVEAISRSLRDRETL